ncbi:hypothetical protein BBJ28_00008595 [Nothophytophthora sp. Chile5]|nr:hypothetical protein BBJ28_00008595 [Nothophytophthora sp. Chile5]
MDELDKQQLTDSERTVVTTADTKRHKKRTKPRNKPNLSWLHRKQELQSLRSQAHAMETRVAFLTLPRSRKEPLENDQEKWKTAALSAKQRLQAARGENTLLEDRLQTYLRTSEAMQARAGPDCHENGGSNAADVDFQRDRLLPFSAETTSGALWAVMKLASIPNEHSVHVARSSNDVMAFKGYSTISLERGGTVDIVAYFLLKRYVVPGDLIVLAESTTERSPRLASSPTLSFSTHDSGWMMVRPVSRDSVMNSASQEVTSLPTHTLSDVIIPSFREIMNLRHQVLDNVLLDAARVEEVERTSHRNVFIPHRVWVKDKAT